MIVREPFKNILLVIFINCIIHKVNFYFLIYLFLLYFYFIPFFLCYRVGIIVNNFNTTVFLVIRYVKRIIIAHEMRYTLLSSINILSNDIVLSRPFNLSSKKVNFILKYLFVNYCMFVSFCLSAFHLIHPKLY